MKAIFSIGLQWILALNLLISANSLDNANRNQPQTLDGDINIYLPFVANGDKTVSTPLDNVSITVTSPVLPSQLIASEPENAIQIATAFSLNPFEELSINSIAYGDTSPVEDLPTAESGGADVYRNELAEFRITQGGTPTSGPTANLFGQLIPSSYSIVPLKIDSDTEKPTIIVEWVVDAFDHLWIVRVTHDISGESNLPSYLSSLQTLVITGSEIPQPSTQTNQIGEINNNDSISNTSIDTLPVPAWWDGDCDDTNYFGATGVHSNRLGATYNGLVACGPRPFTYPKDSLWNPGPRRSFFDGDEIGGIEWQCVELARRYLYLKYGITPYYGHGKDVVSNLHIYHPESPLEVISNGTENQSPKPGDVISYEPGSMYGHVAVVTSSNVDVNGNGEIGIIEQNNDKDGQRTIPIRKWQVRGNMTVSNWLHSPSEIISVGAGPRGIAINPDTNRIYVSNSGDNSVSVIDGNLNEIITTIPVGNAPWGIDVNPVTNKIYVVNGNQGDPLSVIDGESNTVIKQIPVAANARGVSINPITNKVYVTGEFSGVDAGRFVEVIDGNTDTLLDYVPRTPVCFWGSGIDINPLTNRIYVRGSGCLAIIDGDSDVVINHQLINVQTAALGLAVNQMTNRIYEIDNYWAGPLYIIDGYSESIIGTLQVPPINTISTSVGVNPSTNRVFVTNYSGSIAVFDGNSNSFDPNPIFIGGNLWAIAVNQNTNRIYVADVSGNRIIEIDEGAYVSTN